MTPIKDFTAATAARACQLLLICYDILLKLNKLGIDDLNWIIDKWILITF